MQKSTKPNMAAKIINKYGSLLNIRIKSDKALEVYNTIRNFRLLQISATIPDNRMPIILKAANILIAKLVVLVEKPHNCANGIK